MYAYMFIYVYTLTYTHIYYYKELAHMIIGTDSLKLQCEPAGGDPENCT